MKYTEKDFQDYVAGNFGGNLEAFEKWVAENAEAKRLLEQYTNLFTGLKKQPVYNLSINLESTVMQTLQARAGVKKQSSLILNGVLAMVGLAVLVISWMLADPSNIQMDMGLFAGAAIVTVCFAAGLHLLELNRKKEKFRLLME